MDEFIAIRISYEVKEELKNLIKELRKRQLISSEATISSIGRSLIESWTEHQREKLQQLNAGGK